MTFDIDTANTLSQIELLDADGNAFSPTCFEDVCRHADEQRSYVAVVDHDELAHALDKGYKVTRLYNAMIWPEKDHNGESNWSRDMFKG